METKYFQFKDWENAFLYFYQNSQEAQFVVSTHWASEGYWVEPTGTGTTLLDFKINYDAVKKLENAIKDEIAKAEKENRNPNFIL